MNIQIKKTTNTTGIPLFSKNHPLTSGPYNNLPSAAFYIKRSDARLLQRDGVRNPLLFAKVYPDRI